MRYRKSIPLILVVTFISGCVYLGWLWMRAATGNVVAPHAVVLEEVRETPLLFRTAVDSTVSYAISSDGHLARRTSNQWETISELETTSLHDLIRTNGLRTIFFVDVSKGWASGAEQTFETSNGGRTWSLEMQREILSFFFVNRYEGWRTDGVHSFVTSNGGEDWNQCKGNFALRPYDSFFHSKDLGWIISKSATDQLEILRSLDGGCSWRRLWKSESDFDRTPTSIQFTNSKNGWFSTIVGNSLFRTVDGGISWNEVLIPSEESQLEGFFFSDTYKGVLFFASDGSAPLIYQTTDAGKSWSRSAKSFSEVVGEIPFPRASESLRSTVAGY